MDIEKYVRDIKNKLKEDGYVGKLIDYEELKKLHQTYGSDMEEKTFAEEVLGISYSNYSNVKNGGTRAKILKNFLKQLSEEEIEEVQEKLKQAGYAGKLINYEELKELHQTYGKEMEERTFAEEVLGISYGCYIAIKNKGTRTKILKKSYSKISKGGIKQIQEKLKEEGYAEKSIDYKEFKEIYEKYGEQMEEKTFAVEVLRISYSSYHKIKSHQGAKAKILKDVFNKAIEEEIKEIQEKLNGQGYARKAIDYEELKELHQTHGKEMEEKTFAQQVLGISYGNYMRVKNKGTRAKILKDFLNQLSEEEIKEIQDKLKEKGYAGKLIDYEEFKELYKTYGKEMDEKAFAQQVLGLSYDNYGNIKNKGARAKILKDFLKQLSEEEIGKIQEMQKEIKEQGYARKAIDYKELKELHQIYGKQMEEKTFAGEVLGISYGNYMTIKSRGTRAKILKDSPNKVSKEEIKEIQEKLKGQGYARKAIDYEELKELHQTYGKEMEEKIFAEKVLGITYSNYYSLKNKGTRAKILKDSPNKVSKEEIKEIQEKLKGQGYARKAIDYEELKELHQTYGC